MTETQVQEEVQEVATDSQDTELGEVIAESKKYRLRAQKVEAELAELKKQNEESRMAAMEEQEEWKTLANERKATIEELAPIVEKFKANESKYVDELLSDFSEEDRETFKELPISQLRVVHKKLISNKSVQSGKPGKPKGVDKSIGEMSSDEKRRNWASIVDRYS